MDGEVKEWPFDFGYAPGKEIGKGYESIVKEFGGGWVTKGVNPIDIFTKEPKSEVRLAKLKSREEAERVVREQQVLERLMGYERFRRMVYVEVKGDDGKPEYRALQKKVDGIELLKEMHSRKISEERELIENRDEMLEVLWGSKAVLVHYGVPIDFHLGNFMREKGTNTVQVIDAGSPASVADNMTKGSVEDRKRVFLRVMRRVRRMERTEKILNPSDDERERLGKRYGVTTDELTETRAKLRVIQKDLGVTDKEVAAASEREWTSVFLDRVFGDRQLVTGRRMVWEAMKLAGDAPLDARAIVVLNKLRVQADMLHDRDYWEGLIRHPAEGTMMTPSSTS